MLPYQVAWLLDRSRFRIALKARQIWWSTTLAFEAFVGATFRGRRQLVVSSSERQAQEVLSKVKAWAKVAEATGLQLRYETENTTELCIAGGKPILSLAQNPATIEGFSGDVTLDEFTQHSRHREIYRSIFPSITAGYRISVVGVPLGESGTFYDLWTKFPSYSKHRVTIVDAINAGLRVDVDALRSGMDEESFRQQYLCEFIDESTSYLPYDLLLSAVGKRGEGTGRAYCGVDVGRKRDLTCIYVLEQLAGRFFWRRIETLKGATFALQKATIKQVMQAERVERCAIDATGLGMQLAEELQRELNVEPVTMTNPIKESLAVTLKKHLEDGNLILPDEEPLKTETIEDLHGLRKSVTNAGNIRFDADRTEAGHSDRAWALALAVHAAEKQQPRTRIL